MGERNKKCSKCGLVKLLNEFYNIKAEETKKRSHCKECFKNYHQENQEKHRRVVLNWRKNNPERNKEIGKSSSKKFRKQNQLSTNISGAIWRSLTGNKNGQHWEELVGFTLEALKDHLESRFTVGMTFDNYGKWHIDHKRPISSFNFKIPEDSDFKKCWALDNLQPLWAKENQMKHGKLNYQINREKEIE